MSLISSHSIDSTSIPDMGSCISPKNGQKRALIHEMPESFIETCFQSQKNEHDISYIPRQLEEVYVNLNILFAYDRIHNPILKQVKLAQCIIYK